MVGLGLSLTLVDFRRVIVFPKAVTIGLIAQLVGLPVATFGLSLLFYGERQVAPISPSAMLISLMTFTLLPLAMGMILRIVSPEMAERVVEPIRNGGAPRSGYDTHHYGFRLRRRKIVKTRQICYHSSCFRKGHFVLPLVKSEQVQLNAERRVEATELPER